LAYSQWKTHFWTARGLPEPFRYSLRIGDFPDAESAQIAADEFPRREKMERAVRPFGKL
jgi:hypothetical protein